MTYSVVGCNPEMMYLVPLYYHLCPLPTPKDVRTLTRAAIVASTSGAILAKTSTFPHTKASAAVLENRC